MIKWSDYGKKIIIVLIVFLSGIILGYFYKDSKVVIKTEQVLVKGKTVKVETPGKVITTTVWDSKTDSYEKTEINARKYDLLVFYRYDLDNKVKAIGGQFVFEPFSHILIGAGYERGLQVKSNSLMVLAGLRF